jgi:predicted  nucleic acid-binding Zn-ribbon protein
MAKGQDQTLQIFLIIFTILLIGFMAATYFAYSGYSAKSKEVDELQTRLRDEQARVLKFQSDGEGYLDKMGFARSDTADTVGEQFTADMKKYAGTFPESDQKYRRILEVLYTENSKFAKDQAEDKGKIKDLENKLLQIEQEKQKEIANYEAQLKKAEQDAAGEREKFNVQRAQLETAQAQLAKTLAEQRQKFDTEQAKLNEEVSRLNAEQVAMQRTIESLKSKVISQDPSFEVADGQIKHVNQANSTVWINLGEADSVRRQVTFAVIDTSASDVAQAEPKGKIEVTRVLGDHMAEARVIEDDPRDPILPGDMIFNQVWHRGQKLHFALTGKIDLNNDGRDDSAQARDLIALNGGVVDAYVDEDGKVVGEMTVETRYLVLGTFPEATNDANLRKAWDDMNKMADAKGIQTISMVDFINQMGFKSEDRAVTLGSGARSENFRPRPNPRASEMRPRTPYATP